MKTKRSYWTKEEENFLIENWGVLSIPQIANKLNKTEKAISMKKHRLKLGPFIENGDYISGNELFKTLGYSNPRSVLNKTIWKDNGFPMFNKKINTKRVKCVNVNKFWLWAKKNQDLLDFSGYTQYALGKEPKWVNEKRIKDRQKRKYIESKWTQKEDEYLIFLVNQFKYTCKEISDKLNRSENAIHHRLSVLKVMARPLSESKKRWSKDEIKILKDLILEGYNYEEISNKLSRSINSIKTKVYYLCKTKKIDKAKKILEERTAID